MAVTKEYTFSLPMDAEKIMDIAGQIEFVAGDKSRCILNITITQEEQPVDITNNNVQINIKKPDGQVVIQDSVNSPSTVEIVDAVNGLIKITLEDQSLTGVGINTADIVLIDGTSRSTTQEFEYYVRGNKDGQGALQSTSVISYLQQLIAAYEAATNENTVVELTDGRHDNITGQDFNDIGDRMDNHSSQLSDIAISGRQFGVNGDGVTDNTTAIQNAINYVYGIGGGTVLLPIPTVEYKVTGTITLKKNVKLKGVSTFNAYYPDGNIKINHAPTVAGTDLFVSDSVQAGFGYISNLGIEDLMITGNANSRYAIKLVKPSNSVFKNVYIHMGFDEGLNINESINCRFEFIDIDYMDVVCARFTGGVSTSTTFHNCYFHFSPTPIILEQATCLGISFNDQCIFESCTNGLDVYVGNKIQFNDCYAENIPTTSTATSIINLGINGTTESSYAKGVCVVNGGNLAGINGTIHASSKVFNVDKWASLVVIGTRLARSGYSISRTSNTKITAFIGVYEEQITNSIVTTNGVLSLGVNQNGTSHQKLFSEILSIISSTGKEWRLIAEYANTDSDFNIKNISKVGGATTPFRIDAKDNIHMFGTVSPGTSEYLQLFPPKNPIVGSIGNVVAEYCENVDSSAIKKMRRGDGNTGQILSSINGTTASRPTTGKTIGLQYFDTTLGKPIWWNGTAWVDSTGTTV